MRYQTLTAGTEWRKALHHRGECQLAYAMSPSDENAHALARASLRIHTVEKMHMESAIIDTEDVTSLTTATTLFWRMIDLHRRQSIELMRMLPGGISEHLPVLVARYVSTLVSEGLVSSPQSIQVSEVGGEWRVIVTDDALGEVLASRRATDDEARVIRDEIDSQLAALI